jgi:hypothetical protein
VSKQISEVLDQVERAYPGLRNMAKLVLAAVATTRLDRQHPLALILIGGPSSGKTSLLMPLTRGVEDSALRDGVLRVDDFTPASLVSHSANRKIEDLEKIDLLPKLRGKCVIVKEMAPLFTGHEDELMKKFGVFASILDGEGYVSSSGSHGQRGYTDPIVFTLLGAVTPKVLQAKVYACLNAIGPRFCFAEMPPRPLDPNIWRGPDKDRKQIEADATQAIAEFVEDLFERIPEGSVERDEFTISDQTRGMLSFIASLMASLRSQVSVEFDDERKPFISSISVESPERAFRYLEQLVFGAALLDQRKEVQDSDLKLALEVALGSANPSIRRMVRIFFEADRPRTVHDLSIRLELSDDTARKYAEQLQRFEVLHLVSVDGTKEWDLKPPFNSLRNIDGPATNLTDISEPAVKDPSFNDFWSGAPG